LTLPRGPNIIKGMSIWNKILIGFIFVASLVFFYMAARTLKTHEYWRNLARASEFFVRAELESHEGLIGGGQWLSKIEEDQAANKLRDYYRQHGYSLVVQNEMTWMDFTKAVMDAVANTGKLDMRLLEECGKQRQETEGIAQVRLKLHKALIGRGRMWTRCTPQQANKDTGQVSVVVDQPDPHGIADQMVFCVLEEEEVQKGGRLIGEFKVVGVDQKTVALEPVRKMSGRELERLAASKATWTLYEDTPADEHDVFAELEEAQKREVLPEGSLPEYLKDGQPADKDDPQDRQIDGKYVRKLRDYAVLYGKYYLRRVSLAEAQESYNREIKYVSDTLDDAKIQEQFCQTHLDTTKKILSKNERERDAVLALRQTLQSRVAWFQAQAMQTVNANWALTGELAKIQMDAARRIEERTRRLAERNPSGN